MELTKDDSKEKELIILFSKLAMLDEKNIYDLTSMILHFEKSYDFQKNAAFYANNLFINLMRKPSVANSLYDLFLAAIYEKKYNFVPKKNIVKNLPTNWQIKFYDASKNFKKALSKFIISPNNPIMALMLWMNQK